MKILKTSKGRDFKVDDEDYDRCKDIVWHSRRSTNRHETWYVYRCIMVNKKEKYQLLHRFLLGVSDRKIQVDHRDLDGENCQKYNLRECGQSQNNANRRVTKTKSSDFKGVVFCSKNTCKAQIQVEGIKIYLGCFKKHSDAARAYDEAAIRYFGEFALLNFPLK